MLSLFFLPFAATASVRLAAAPTLTAVEFSCVLRSMEVCITRSITIITCLALPRLALPLMCSSFDDGKYYTFNHNHYLHCLAFDLFFV
jgi:hypothetical protein